MKRVTTILFIALLFGISCNPEDDHLKLYKGEVMAVRNGDCWEALPYGLKNDPFDERIDLRIRRFSREGYMRESMHLFRIPKKEGRYALVLTDNEEEEELAGASYRTLVDDGDVLGDSFLLLEGEVENYIELTHVKGKKLEGHFQVAFIRDTTFADADPTVPDTVIFTQGKFETKIIHL